MMCVPRLWVNCAAQMRIVSGCPVYHHTSIFWNSFEDAPPSKLLHLLVDVADVLDVWVSEIVAFPQNEHIAF